MRTLIVYATNSGGTEEAARIIRDELVDAGHEVELKRAYHADPAALSTFDLIVLGSCTWDNIVNGKREEGQLQEHMQQFLARVPAASMANRRVAVFGLGDSSYNVFCGAADHLAQWVQQSGATQQGETLKIDGYFFNLPVNRKRIIDWAATLASAA